VAVDQTFVSAYIDNDTVHRVLGVRLRRFCAWHLFQLQVIDSPFVNAGEVYLYHLRRAVGICRLSFPCSKTRPPFFPLVINQEKLSREVQKFLAYIGDYLQRPEYTIMPMDEFSRSRYSRPTRNPSPPPEMIQLVFDAAHGANVSIPEAWNMPIGQAYIAQAMHLKNQGVLVDFMTEKEREFQAALKAHLETQGNGVK
jgi:hypothetical protein